MIQSKLRRPGLCSSLLFVLLLGLHACGDAPTPIPPTATAVAIPTVALAVTTPVSSVTGATSPASGTTVAASGAIKIRLSFLFPLDKNSVYGVMASRFIELVQQKAGGRVVIETFPNWSLSGGDVLTGLSLLQSGKTEAALITNSIYSNKVSGLELTNYPFIFQNEDKAYRFIDSAIGKQILGNFEAANLKALAVAGQGFAQLTNSKRAVVSPADLKGMRIRVPQNPLYTKIYKLLDVETVTVPFGQELYKALQEKRADGQDNPIIVDYQNKFYEVQPYFTVWNYLWIPIILSFNLDFWKTLPPDIQKILEESAVESVGAVKTFVIENEKKALEEMKKYGVQVSVLTPDQQKVFLDLMRPLYQEAETTYGKDYMERVLKAAQG